MSPTDPKGASRPATGARKSAPARKPSPAGRTPKSAPGEVEVHDAGRLRDAISKLIEPGDITTRDNGSVRPARVAEVRQHVEDGAYSQRDVLASIVDRLLDQWQI